jgi:hypothetical protein
MPSLMSEYIYRPGDRVRTPNEAEGVVVAIHHGPVRGRMWREPQYFIDVPGMRTAAYYESELKLVRPS